MVRELLLFALLKNGMSFVCRLKWIIILADMFILLEPLHEDMG